MTRVKVMSGDGQKFLGLGNLVGHVDVYAIWANDRLISLPDPSKKPDQELLDKTGGELIEILTNPKIALDSGEIVYGCQVWWEKVEDNNDENDEDPKDI